MQKAIDTGNVQTFYGCFVEKLIMEDGRCRRQQCEIVAPLNGVPVVYHCD